MRVSDVPSSAGFCSPLSPHSSSCPLSSLSSARGPLDTTPTRRNPMSHEDVLNHSQEQPSTLPTAASLPGPSPAGKHSRLVWFLMIPVALCVFGLFTWFSKSRSQTALAASTQASAADPVSVFRPQMGNLSDELILPATLQAFSESPIYARTNGYVSHWYADIGQPVRNGEILALIDSPEGDQQLIR